MPNTRFQSKKLCYGCGQPGHILFHFPNRNLHLARFQHHVDLGDFKAYILENSVKDINEHVHKILLYNEEVETQLVDATIKQDKADIEMECWISDLFNIVDNTDNATPLSPPAMSNYILSIHGIEYGSVLVSNEPLSLMGLK